MSREFAWYHMLLLGGNGLATQFYGIMYKYFLFSCFFAEFHYAVYDLLLNGCQSHLRYILIVYFPQHAIEWDFFRKLCDEKSFTLCKCLCPENYTSKRNYLPPLYHIISKISSISLLHLCFFTRFFTELVKI